ncbi:MAG: hypothetical protein ACPL3C_11895 [Pyrobaculum sp.]|jgi:hypothetical protein|uniref:hypothetical protein n=1 Tax=unclassified Pyrobaculum TaxID=2643434 RepID=UPI0021DB2669|nr:hypothetical protein [Pyrobaculum sp. 3827-6]MCU7786761.1 hypothetical protein [Pyrobaculum sp. 3827-6]
MVSKHLIITITIIALYITVILLLAAYTSSHEDNETARHGDVTNTTTAAVGRQWRGGRS